MTPYNLLPDHLIAKLVEATQKLSTPKTAAELEAKFDDLFKRS